MATYYMDYINGSDANSGSDFANAKQTINGFTAAILVPGDTIRIAKSPDPTSLGQTATWNNVSKVVTLSNTVSTTIDLCETGWTAGSGVTRTYDATSFKEGAASLKLVTDGTVTTARKLAYKTISSTNCAGYTQLSFWFNNAATLASGILQVKLCDDTTGDNAIDTFDIPASALTTTHWYPLVINKGSALGSAIQSIAIYSTASYASKTNYFDNFIVCKDPASPDSLNLTSLISKNTSTSEGWYPIQSMDGVNIKIDNQPSTIGSAGKGYYGATENVLTYKRETIKTTILDGDAASFTFTVQDSGSAGNLITYEGGYNTATNTRDGETFFDGQTGSSNGLYATAKTFNKFNYLSFARYWYGITIVTNCHDYILSNTNVVACSFAGIWLITNQRGLIEGYVNANNNNAGMVIRSQTSLTMTTPINANNNIQSTGVDGAGVSFYQDTGPSTGTISGDINCNNCVTGFYANSVNMTWALSTINANYCSSSGVSLAGSSGQVVPVNINVNNCYNGIVFGSFNTSTFNGAITAYNCANIAVYFSTSLGVTLNGVILGSLAGITGNSTNIYIANSVKNITFNGDVTVSGGTYGFQDANGCANIRFNGITTISSAASIGAYVNVCRDVFFKKLILTNTGTYGVYCIGGGTTYINSGSCTGATNAFYSGVDKIYASNFTVTGGTYAIGMQQYTDATVYISNCGDAQYNHKAIMYGGIVQSDNGVRHTASGISWKLSPTSTDRTANYPVRTSVAKIAVNADAPVTITAWMRRDDLGITGTLYCQGGQVAGVANTVSSSLTGPINTWELLTLTLNPTQQRVVEISALAYGGTTWNVWIDDLGVSQ